MVLVLSPKVAKASRGRTGWRFVFTKKIIPNKNCLFREMANTLAAAEEELPEKKVGHCRIKVLPMTSEVEIFFQVMN